jgi:superfamily II DNA or RNA helicase
VNIDFTLSPVQTLAHEKLVKALEEKEVCLLHGVTSSGKTQVYIKLIEAQVLAGKQVLYLLPEIALTAQIIRRLQQHFGGYIAIYHSRFNPNERVELWNKVKKGEIRVVLGARSALFLPFADLSLIIVDEAHNASSPLSFEVLERINPSCVVEYTATPELKTSNVLYNVSASELKAEEMIKLPIMLAERSNWQEAISDSIRTREYLNELAHKDKDYIRPIVLFQAENKDKEVTQAVVLGHLVSVEKIDRTRIAIVTGEQRELDDVNLFDPNCTIDYVITVEALKEGWDCSFAYVFCSLANVKSKTSIEQLLGRVLRMPYAKRREQDELNKAYAFVTSQSWGNTVSFLHDRLVSMGFDQQEADSYIEQGYLGLEGG